MTTGMRTGHAVDDGVNADRDAPAMGPESFVSSPASSHQGERLGGPGFRLHRAETFWRRLLGVHALGGLAAHEGLLLKPCSAIHTFFLDQAMDVVFLDAQGAECDRLADLPPRRFQRKAGAYMVVELPAGYCRRHPDYLRQIHQALQSDGSVGVAEYADVGRIKTGVQHGGNGNVQRSHQQLRGSGRQPEDSQQHPQHLHTKEDHPPTDAI